MSTQAPEIIETVFTILGFALTAVGLVWGVYKYLSKQQSDFQKAIDERVDAIDSRLTKTEKDVEYMKEGNEKTHTKLDLLLAELKKLEIALAAKGITK